MTAKGIRKYSPKSVVIQRVTELLNDPLVKPDQIGLNDIEGSRFSIMLDVFDNIGKKTFTAVRNELEKKLKEKGYGILYYEGYQPAYHGYYNLMIGIKLLDSYINAKKACLRLSYDDKIDRLWIYVDLFD